MADEKPDAPSEGGEAPKKNKQLMTGVAVGIGSAAIVAALLSANRSKTTEKND